MQYMLLIVAPRDQRAERGVEAGQRAYAQMGAFAAELKQRGVLLGAQSLASETTGTRVRVRDGQIPRRAGAQTTMCAGASGQTRAIS